MYMYIQKPECIRWTWSGDVYNRKVICLEWRKEEKEKKGNKKCYIYTMTNENQFRDEAGVYPNRKVLCLSI